MNADDAYAEIDAERRLALAYVPRDRRAAFAAVWALDSRMARVFASASQPVLAEIKLAWWEQRLAALPAEGPPDEPLLRALAAQAFERPATLVGLAAAWRELCGAPLDARSLDAYATLRAGAVTDLASEILRFDADDRIALAAEGWALSELRDLLRAGRDRELAADAATLRFAQAGRKAWPWRARPWGMIVELARDDTRNPTLDGGLKRKASPRRVARMIWHAASGW